MKIKVFDYSTKKWLTQEQISHLKINQQSSEYLVCHSTNTFDIHHQLIYEHDKVMVDDQTWGTVENIQGTFGVVTTNFQNDLQFTPLIQLTDRLTVIKANPQDRKVTGLDDYQHLTNQTANQHSSIAGLGLGIAGEAGEVADIIKKVEYHHHPLNRDHLIEELGDVMWYLAQIAETEQLSLSQIATHNISKLLQRYPHGFNSQDSLKRVDHHQKG